jgi:hypothetical protein
MKKWLVGAAATMLLAATGASIAAAPEHFLFAWAGDTTEHAEDFIAVIDAQPDSPHYGQLSASAASGIPVSKFTTPNTGCLPAAFCSPMITRRTRRS